MLIYKDVQKYIRYKDISLKNKLKINVKNKRLKIVNINLIY